MTVREKTSVTLKYLIVVASLGGVLLSLFTATKDGYSHWARRLLYFTAQSNIWIGVTTLFILLFSFTAYNEKREKRLYLFRFVFTVSITLTGVVFCGILAPFADKYGFRTWSFSSILTHALSPALSIADFFLDKRNFSIENKHVALCAVPPVLYFLTSFILEFFYVDFGRGEPYPYFFMNFRSPVGVFGFSSKPPFVMGTFYWFLIFPALLFIIAFSYKRLYNRKKAK
ncbi:MAG: hypothetical protein IJ329_04355 [Clostridia bacterium]|nr:hypothetical protein [Clostridia bacterium]